MHPTRRFVVNSLFGATVMAAALSAISARAQDSPSRGTSAADEKKASAGKVRALTAASPLPECSLSKTNKQCALVVDREHPLSPSTVQMYSNESLTVVVENPKNFERYFLDYQSGQATLKPDVASSVIQGLLPSLAKLQVHAESTTATGHVAAPLGACHGPKITILPKEDEIKDVFPAFQGCLGYLANSAIDIYHELEPYVAPDSLTPFEKPAMTLKDIQDKIMTFKWDEVTFSNSISAISKTYPTPKAGDVNSEDIAQLANMQKTADQIAVDLANYNQRINDLSSISNYNGSQPCANVIQVPKNKKIVLPAQCVSIQSAGDVANVYQNTVTRTVTYALNTYNLVLNSQEASPDPTKKKLLATVAINFADAPKSAGSLRLEASAGAFFSTLPIRSFAAAPIFTNGAVADKKIVQNVLHPTVVPFAAANYRLTNDLPWTRWRSNFYLTGAVGVNPNTVSADFAAGLSWSFRALMVSGLAHFGHDVRLSQGLTVGESLGAGFNGSLPTHTCWTTSFAVGLSVRIPSLVGR